MSLPHKDYVLPQLDLSGDDGDASWHEAQQADVPPEDRAGLDGIFTPVYREDGTVRHYAWNGLPPGFWAGYWKDCIVDEWARLVTEYEANPDDVFNCWHYLDHHPVFWRFTDKRTWVPVRHVGRLEHEYAMSRGWPEISPHKVNPETDQFDEDEKLNTKIQWWYEFGPYPLTIDEHCPPWHDYKLDGGADTYEQAVTEIALKVWQNYGNDRTIVDSEKWQKGE